MRANGDLRQVGRQDELKVFRPRGHALRPKQDAERARLTRMTRDFQIAMSHFQDIQRGSLEKCRDFVVRARAIARESATPSPPQSPSGGGGDGHSDGEGDETSPLFPAAPSQRCLAQRGRG